VWEGASGAKARETFGAMGYTLALAETETLLGQTVAKSA
jgi:hypothetical protein